MAESGNVEELVEKVVESTEREEEPMEEEGSAAVEASSEEEKSEVEKVEAEQVEEDNVELQTESQEEEEGSKEAEVSTEDSSAQQSEANSEKMIPLEEYYSTPDRHMMENMMSEMANYPLRESETHGLSSPTAQTANFMVGSMSLVPPTASAALSLSSPGYFGYIPSIPDYDRESAIAYSTQGIPYNTAPSLPPGPQHYLSNSTKKKSKGSKLFSDMFSRADKNDDGGLTFEEFRDYFADNILNDGELIRLFTSIDTDGNGNISLFELDSYFRKGFEPYEQLFGSLAKIHSALSSSLSFSYESYPYQNVFEQFKTRTFLHEFMGQLSSLSSMISHAHEVLENASKNSRPQPVAEREVVREMPAEASSSDVLHNLQNEVNRLAAVVERLDKSSVKLQWVENDVFDEEFSHESAYVVACRNMEIVESSTYLYRDCVRRYIEATKLESGCRHIYVKQMTNENKYSMYEIYHNEDALCQHNTSPHFRSFQKELIDYLEEPMSTTLMEMPTSWWGN